MPETALATYLNDHLAGATAGRDLAARMREDHGGSALERLLTELAPEIEADRDVLVAIMDRLGIDRSAMKQAAGWVAERVSRVKLHEPMSGNADLTRFLECEMLSTGIEGKRLLWLALAEHKRRERRLAAVDFDELVARAEAQRAELEPHRLEAAVKAFA